MLRATDFIERTDIGRQRRGNEDSSFARPPVFVVADGMGGAQAGEIASRIAVETFERGLPDDGSPEERLAACVQTANKQIYERSRTEHERAGMGTTLTAAYLDDTQVAIAHVGDSRAYLFRDGKLQRLTRDHSLVGELVRQGKLTEEQAEEHPQRSIITRALGPEPTVDVDTSTYPGRAGDVLLLCSDGLTSMISEEQIADTLASSEDLASAADQLIDEANAAGGRDNITVVLFRLEEVGADAPIEHETMVGVPAPGAPPGAGAPTASTVAPPPDSPSTTTTAAVRVPLARTQGRPSDVDGTASRRRSRRFVKPLAVLLTIVIVLGLIGAGGYLASRQLYFIGTNSQGIVTVYRGFPYDLPAGVHLYETYYVSGVPASEIPPDRRSSLLNHHLRSQKDASSLVRTLELGQLAQ
jgi:PPM family protein phosphatase